MYVCMYVEPVLNFSFLGFIYFIFVVFFNFLKYELNKINFIAFLSTETPSTLDFSFLFFFFCKKNNKRGKNDGFLCLCFNKLFYVYEACRSDFTDRLKQTDLLRTFSNWTSETTKSFLYFCVLFILLFLDSCTSRSKPTTYLRRHNTTNYSINSSQHSKPAQANNKMINDHV